MERTHEETPGRPGEGPWGIVERLHGWLDASSTLPAEQERLLRLLKLTEETGEVASAVVGATGQNPRKGFTHSCYL